MKDYKKILEGVVDIINTTEKSDMGFANICAYIGENCPEVKESENIKIIKAIKYGLDYVFTNNTTVFEVTKEQCLSWLEKQGKYAGNKEECNECIKQNESTDICNSSIINGKEFPASEKRDFGYFSKPADKVELKFKVGDEIKTTNEEPLTITKIDEKGYWSEDLFICGFDDADKWELVEQKPAWSEEGKQYLKIEGYENLSDYEKIFDDIADRYVRNKNQKGYNQSWYVKERAAEMLYQANKELKKKANWSEEDEDIRDNIIRDLKRLGGDMVSPNQTYQKEINWLKSLRPQSTWKPSDEQMNSLKQAISTFPYETDYLELLYDDLKKLREE